MRLITGYRYHGILGSHIYDFMSDVFIGIYILY